jgi:hypothetical protein
LPAIEAPRSQSAIPNDYEVYNNEEVHIEGDPASFEEAMSRPNASKWQEAMEDDMRSMRTEDHVWFEDQWMVASLCDE